MTDSQDAEIERRQAAARAFAEPPRPRYPWGATVRALVDLHNDGSHPGGAEGDVLVATGAEGRVMRVGHHEESRQPVYLVEFDGGVLVGCLESELACDAVLPAGPRPGVME